MYITHQVIVSNHLDLLAHVRKATPRPSPSPRPRLNPTCRTKTHTTTLHQQDRSIILSRSRSPRNILVSSRWAVMRIHSMIPKRQGTPTQACNSILRSRTSLTLRLHIRHSHNNPSVRLSEPDLTRMCRTNQPLTHMGYPTTACPRPLRYCRNTRPSPQTWATRLSPHSTRKAACTAAQTTT